MHVRRHRVVVTTAADGTGTGYTPVETGYVLAIKYVKTDYADGIDLTVTAESSGLGILVDENMNASEEFFPRQKSKKQEDGSVFVYDINMFEPMPIPVADERIKIAIAAGGDTKSGTFHVYVGG